VRRLLSLAVAAAVVAAGLALAAVAYEVLGLGASLTRVVRELRGAPAADAGRAPRGPRPAGPAAAGEAGGPSREAEVSFTLDEADLGRVLARRDRWLGGALAVSRAAACRVEDGHVAVATRNEVRLLGLPVARYPGFSDWALTLRPRGVGVRLDALRVAGVPVPGAGWLLARLGPREDGWVVVATGPRHRVDRLRVDDGKLSVSGTVRARG